MSSEATATELAERKVFGKGLELVGVYLVREEYIRAAHGCSASLYKNNPPPRARLSGPSFDGSRLVLALRRFAGRLSRSFRFTSAHLASASTRSEQLLSLPPTLNTTLLHLLTYFYSFPASNGLRFSSAGSRGSRRRMY